MGIEFDSSSYIHTVKRVFESEQEIFRSFVDNSSKVPEEKVDEISEFPSMVQVGVSTVCNLRCPQCYYPDFQHSPDYHPQFMSPDIYRIIIEEMESFPATTILRYLGRGESLTHPNIVGMISQAKDHVKGKVVLITNGLLMRERMASSILDTGIDVVDFSLDALTHETYGLVRGGNFELLASNVEKFIELRDEGSYPTKVMVSFLIQPENYFEAEEFKDFWGQKADKVIFRRYHSYAGKISEKSCVPEERHACAALWNRVNINENGRITLCYIDWNELSVLGDLNEVGATILDTWKNDAYRAARKGHIDGEYPSLCADCKTGWQAAHWQLSYEQAVAMATRSER